MNYEKLQRLCIFLKDNGCDFYSMVNHKKVICYKEDWEEKLFLVVYIHEKWMRA